MTQAVQETIAVDGNIQSSIRRLDELLQQVEHIADPAARETAGQIIQAMMEFHGAGLAKILERVAEAGELGQAMIDDLGQDDAVGSLLLLYGMHPLDIESRVRQALEKARPYLKSHGGNVEVLEVTEDGIVRLQMQGSCHGCPSSAITLKNTIEQAIYDRAPDVTAIQIADAEHESANHHPEGFVPVEQLLSGNGKHSLRGKSS